MTNQKILVIDVGGTKIKYGLGYNGKLLEVNSVSTGDYDKDLFLCKIDDIVTFGLSKGIEKVSISMNGQISFNKIVFSRILGGKLDFDIHSYLEEKYNLEFIIENDVNCMALGCFNVIENIDDNMLLINLGTGLRSAYITGEFLLKGSKGYFGEIRDFIYVKELNSEINLNDLVCGRGISNIYRIITGKLANSKDIFAGFLKGDNDSIRTVDIFKKYLVRLLSRLSYHYNPKTIVIDGSVKVVVDYLLSDIIIDYKQITEEHFQAKILISEIENSNLIGAYHIGLGKNC